MNKTQRKQVIKETEQTIERLKVRIQKQKNVKIKKHSDSIFWLKVFMSNARMRLSYHRRQLNK